MVLSTALVGFVGAVSRGAGVLDAEVVTVAENTRVPSARTAPRTSTRTLGEQGEHHACAYLSSLGYRIIETNWRCREGELDIVALDGDEVVVVEVKTRRSTRFGPAVEAVTFEKHRRLRRLAALWMREHDVRASGVRLDVVGVELDGDAIRVDHRRRVIL